MFCTTTDICRGATRKCVHPGTRSRSGRSLGCFRERAPSRGGRNDGDALGAAGDKGDAVSKVRSARVRRLRVRPRGVRCAGDVQEDLLPPRSPPSLSALRQFDERGVAVSERKVRARVEYRHVVGPRDDARPSSLRRHAGLPLPPCSLARLRLARLPELPGRQRRRGRRRLAAAPLAHRKCAVHRAPRPSQEPRLASPPCPPVPRSCLRGVTATRPPTSWEGPPLFSDRAEGPPPPWARLGAHGDGGRTVGTRAAHPPLLRPLPAAVAGTRTAHSSTQAVAHAAAPARARGGGGGDA